MTEVLRFWCHDASNIRCVRESDFDAEHQLRLAAEQRLAVLEGDGSWGDMALTVKLENAERQVGELREQRDSLANGMFDLQASLNEAMGLLREAFDDKWCWVTKDPRDWARRMRTFVASSDFNTTGTEGKDHE